MGRPINDRWLGKPEGNEFKLQCIANINGSETLCWLYHQRSTNEFDIIENNTEIIRRGYFIANTEDISAGEFFIQLDGPNGIEFVRKITNRKVYTFDNKVYKWNEDDKVSANLGIFEDLDDSLLSSDGLTLLDNTGELLTSTET